MKSIKYDVGTDELNQKNKKINNFQSQIKQVLCVEGCKAICICLSKNCKKPAFVCGQEMCICQKTHQKCSIRKLKGVIKTIQEKINYFHPIVKQNERMILQRIEQHKNIIKNLQLFLNEINQIMREEGFKNLSICQKAIYQSILSKKTDQLKGCNIFNLQKELQKIANFQMKIQVNKTNLTWKKYRTELKDYQYYFISQLKDYFKLKKLKSQSNYFQSNILNDENQFQLIEKILPKNIIGFNLLYRASDYSFSNQIFRQRCSNVPHTLTILKTGLQKKIGFYTPFMWLEKSKIPENKYNIVKDQQNKTIMLSFPTRSFNHHEILNNCNYGPCFIDKQDYSRSIKIPGKSNSYLLNNSTFYDSQYIRSVIYESQMRVLEYQVWEVIYDC